MKYDRRRAPRIDVNLPTTWEGVIERVSAEITSLSRTGCFVLSGGRVSAKELVRLEIQLPYEDEPVCIWGEVVEEAYEIGFAAKFTTPLEDSSADPDEQRLVKFIDRTQQR